MAAMDGDLLYFCEDEKRADADSDGVVSVDLKDVEAPKDVGAPAAATPSEPPPTAQAPRADAPQDEMPPGAEHHSTVREIAHHVSESILAQHSGFKGDDLELLSTFKSLRSHVDLLATRDRKDLCERQFLRDELAAALKEESNSPSVYVLYWSMHNLAKSTQNAKFDYRWAYRYCILAMVIQMLVPFFIIAVYVHPRLKAGDPWLEIACPMAHKEMKFLDFAVHVVGYLLCIMNFLSSWGKVKDEALVFEFLAKCKHVPFDMSDQKNTGVLIPEFEDAPLSPQAQMLSIAADIQELSCKRCARRAAFRHPVLSAGVTRAPHASFARRFPTPVKVSLLALAALMYTSAALVDIVLNCLALHFIQDVDNFLKPSQCHATITMEFGLWVDELANGFENEKPGYGPLYTSDAVTKFLQHEVDKPSVSVMGVDIPFDVPGARSFIRRRGPSSRSVLKSVLSSFDVLGLPLVIYFVFFTGFCL